MLTVNYLTIAAYAAGLVLTLVLAAFLTPSRWWQRPNVRALTVLVAGTWGLGTLLLAATQTPAMAAATSATHGVAAVGAASYRVHQDLNLRAASGTAAPRIAVVPAGSVVTTTGLRDGDWWQVSAKVAGREVRGWSSSLWLRRADEARH